MWSGLLSTDWTMWCGLHSTDWLLHFSALYSDSVIAKQYQIETVNIDLCCGFSFRHFLIIWKCSSIVFCNFFTYVHIKFKIYTLRNYQLKMIKWSIPDSIQIYLAYVQFPFPVGLKYSPLNTELTPHKRTLYCILFPIQI
jgi:hypothetical protein